jgi:hypothetical protein
MITIVSYAPHLTLALSSVVNYDRKWTLQIVVSLTIIKVRIVIVL